MVRKGLLAASLDDVFASYRGALIATRDVEDEKEGEGGGIQSDKQLFFGKVTSHPSRRSYR